MYFYSPICAERVHALRAIRYGFIRVCALKEETMIYPIYRRFIDVRPTAIRASYVIAIITVRWSKVVFLAQSTDISFAYLFAHPLKLRGSEFGLPCNYCPVCTKRI